MASLSYCSQSHLSAVTCHKFQSFAVEPMAEDQSLHKPFDSTSIGPNTSGKKAQKPSLVWSSIKRLKSNAVHARSLRAEGKTAIQPDPCGGQFTRRIWANQGYPCGHQAHARRRGEQLHRRDLKCKHVVFANVCVCVCKCLLTVCRPLAGVFANIGVCKQ